MVAVPVPHPSQSPQPYRVRCQESYAEPFAPREFGYRPQTPFAAPQAYQAPAPARAYTSTYTPTPAPEPVRVPAPSSEAEPVRAQAEVAAAAVTVSAAMSASAQSVGSVFKDQDWINLLAAGTMLAGGALLISGHKRAGLIVAAAGTALALIDEKEAIEALWKKLPAYLKEAQTLLEKAEGYMNDLGPAAQKLYSVAR